MAITTEAQVLSSLANAPVAIWLKNISITAGTFYSTWLATGYPTPPAAPTGAASGALLDKTSPGAIPFPDPASGTLYVARMQGAQHTGAQIFYLYDRLWNSGPLSATQTTAQTINSVALNRPDANGVNAEAWHEVYALMGSETVTVAPTISYTNTAGTAGRTGTLLGYTGSRNITYTSPFSLQAGDLGVKSIQSFTNPQTNTSGTPGLVLRRRIAAIGGVWGPMQLNHWGTGLPRVDNGAALEVVGLSGGTASGVPALTVELVSG